MYELWRYRHKSEKLALHAVSAARCDRAPAISRGFRRPPPRRNIFRPQTAEVGLGLDDQIEFRINTDDFTIGELEQIANGNEADILRVMRAHEERIEREKRETRENEKAVLIPGDKIGPVKGNA